MPTCLNVDYFLYMFLSLFSYFCPSSCSLARSLSGLNATQWAYHMYGWHNLLEATICRHYCRIDGRLWNGVVLPFKDMRLRNVFMDTLELLITVTILSMQLYGQQHLRHSNQIPICFAAAIQGALNLRKSFKNFTLATPFGKMLKSYIELLVAKQGRFNWSIRFTLKCHYERLQTLAESIP